MGNLGVDKRRSEDQTDNKKDQTVAKNYSSHLGDATFDNQFRLRTYCSL